MPVFFSPLMVAPPQGCSPSASKPLQVVESWIENGLPVRLIEPEPATIAQFALAHDERHVREILAGRTPNGFGNRSLKVAASLPYTTGSMLSAARHVLVHGGAASAPCSGFHHAGYRSTGGFCTFNGLMVTACALRQEGLVQRVGVLDLDQHFANGTEDIIDRLDARGWVRHFTAGGEFHDASQAKEFVKRLPREIAAMADCDVVLYQAGADPHIDDPLGGWLTTEQLRARDALVFEQLHTMGVPVAWGLAGGYIQEPDGSIPRVLAVHLNTAIECVRVFGETSGPTSYGDPRRSDPPSGVEYGEDGDLSLCDEPVDMDMIAVEVAAAKPTKRAYVRKKPEVAPKIPIFKIDPSLPVLPGTIEQEDWLRKPKEPDPVDMDAIHARVAAAKATEGGR